MKKQITGGGMAETFRIEILILRIYLDIKFFQNQYFFVAILN